MVYTRIYRGHGVPWPFHPLPKPWYEGRGRTLLPSKEPRAPPQPPPFQEQRVGHLSCQRPSHTQSHPRAARCTVTAPLTPHRPHPQPSHIHTQARADQPARPPPPRAGPHHLRGPGMTVAILLPGSCPQQVPAGSVLPAVGRAQRPPIHSFPRGGRTRATANHGGGAGRPGRAGSGSPRRGPANPGAGGARAVTHTRPRPTCAHASLHIRPRAHPHMAVYTHIHITCARPRTPTHAFTQPHACARFPARRLRHLTGGRPDFAPIGLATPSPPGDPTLSHTGRWPLQLSL